MRVRLVVGVSDALTMRSSEGVMTRSRGTCPVLVTVRVRASSLRSTRAKSGVWPKTLSPRRTVAPAGVVRMLIATVDGTTGFGADSAGAGVTAARTGDGAGVACGIAAVAGVAEEGLEEASCLIAVGGAVA